MRPTILCRRTLGGVQFVHRSQASFSSVRSLFELHRMENEDNNAFTTFDLYVNAKDGHVQVLNVDCYGSLGHRTIHRSFQYVLNERVLEKYQYLQPVESKLGLLA